MLFVWHIFASLSVSGQCGVWAQDDRLPLSFTLSISLHPSPSVGKREKTCGGAPTTAPPGSCPRRSMLEADTGNPGLRDSSYLDEENWLLKAMEICLTAVSLH